MLKLVIVAKATAYLAFAGAKQTSAGAVSAIGDCDAEQLGCKAQVTSAAEVDFGSMSLCGELEVGRWRRCVPVVPSASLHCWLHS